MNTTAAAAEAKVTVATIRHWCRYGAVAAVKRGGRWVIDAASLAHRVTIGTRKAARRAPKPVVLTVESMVAIGGNRWQKSGMDRVYINDWQQFAGLEVSTYKTGNISSASYGGEGISNSQAYKIAGAIDKVWFDAADGKLHARYGYGNPRIGRDQVWADVVAGIRNAIAAL